LHSVLEEMSAEQSADTEHDGEESLL